MLYRLPGRAWRPLKSFGEGDLTWASKTEAEQAARAVAKLEGAVVLLFPHTSVIGIEREKT